MPSRDHKLKASVVSFPKVFFPKVFFLAVLFQVLGSKAFATPVLFLPRAGANLYAALLESSTSLGEAGLAFRSVVGGPEAGGSSAAITGAFPLIRSTDPRNSGWMWAIAAGMTDFSYTPTEVLSPSFYFYEIGLGRGTAGLADENDTGLRGSFEVTLRDQSPKHSQNLDTALSLLGRTLPNHSYSLVIRIGAAVDVSGHGLPAQAPPATGYSFFTSVYLPILSSGPSQSLLITVEGRGLMRCFSDEFFCGVDIELFDSRNPAVSADDVSQVMEYGLTAGLFFRYRLYDRYVFELSPRFSVMSAPYRAVVSKLPYLQANIQIAF